MSNQAVDVLVERCREVTTADIPAAATQNARHCVLDAFGVGLVGSQTHLASTLRRTVGCRSGECTVLGSPERVRQDDAALLNGTAMHALDFDDTQIAIQGHPTAAILPAVLAVAEQRQASQDAVLAALAVGVEVAATFGSWVNPTHYERGWHSTGTLGTIGAAAACAHMLQFDVDEWTTALALAATQAAGLRGAFGSMAKPFHAGRAAANGLLSARLAAEGFSCARAALDGPAGFLGIHADPDRLVAPSENSSWAIQDMLFKFHAACYMTHAPIMNARKIVRDYGLAVSDIASVEVLVAPELQGICSIITPQSGLEGKFSLHLTTALALAGLDTADEETFSEHVLADPLVSDLRGRVHVKFVSEFRGRGTRARTCVTTRSGKQYYAEHDTGEPEHDLDAQEAKLMAKFRLLAGKVLDIRTVEDLAAEITHGKNESVVRMLRLGSVGDSAHLSSTNSSTIIERSM